ncbi:MAG: DUF2092 domain-containing protein [Vicinamibacterales bacterium]
MKPLVLMLCLCAATAMAQTPSAQRRHQTRTDSSIDARASSALAGMTAFLKTMKTFRITSESSRDEIVDTDMKVQKIASNVMTVRLPDRLQAHVRSDDQDLQFFYNGQTLTVFSREKNYYGSTPVPPTVARMLDATRARHGIVMPLVDFIQMAAGEDFQQSIIGAGYIGTSRIGGVECDHLAIRQTDVDWQVWIEKSQTPLPRRLVITTKTEPTQPQYISTLTWDLSPTIDDTLFTFTPPPNAVRIMFARTKDGAQTPAKP